MKLKKFKQLFEREGFDDIDDPFYDETRDIAIIKIKVKLLNFNKKLVLVSRVMPPHDEY